MAVPLELLKNLIDTDSFEKVLEKRSEGQDPVEFLLEEKLLEPRDLLLKLSAYWKIPFVELDHYEPDREVLNLFSEEVARRFMVMPLFLLEDRLYSALWDQDNLGTIDFLRQLTGFTIEPILATRADIEASINRFFLSKEQVAQKMDTFAEQRLPGTIGGVKDQEELHIQDEEAPAIKLVNYIISQAVNMDASDIHLEPYEKRAILRYRVDGVLHEFPPPPNHLLRSLVTRIKIISNMDVAEKRMPQDGRTSVTVEGRKYDLRVSVIPNINGEGVVIRVLDTESKGMELTDLGFSPDMLDSFRHIVSRPYGIFLVTGPTGSGKSTTLYATLKTINTPKRKLITIEDPVEYKLEGVSQIQVHPAIGYTFAAGLRAILRHDPDVIMVGEIRDLETAEIAVRSSLTGHLVFSTLHTNDSPTALTRLIDMGVAPYLVLTSLNGVLAQRLVRKLCPKCKKEAGYTIDDLGFLGLKEIPSGAQLYEPVGCTACSNLGYKGREAILEMIEVTPEMRQLSREGVTAEKVKEMAKANGYTSLREKPHPEVFQWSYQSGGSNQLYYHKRLVVNGKKNFLDEKIQGNYCNIFPVLNN